MIGSKSTSVSLNSLCFFSERFIMLIFHDSIRNHCKHNTGVAWCTHQNKRGLKACEIHLTVTSVDRTNSSTPPPAIRPPTAACGDPTHRWPCQQSSRCLTYPLTTYPASISSLSNGKRTAPDARGRPHSARLNVRGLISWQYLTTIQCWDAPHGLLGTDGRTECRAIAGRRAGGTRVEIDRDNAVYQDA